MHVNASISYGMFRCDRVRFTTDSEALFLTAFANGLTSDPVAALTATLRTVHALPTIVEHFAYNRFGQMIEHRTCLCGIESNRAVVSRHAPDLGRQVCRHGLVEHAERPGEHDPVGAQKTFFFRLRHRSKDVCAGRGIAGALTSFLVADAFKRGCRCIFLSAADETVQRVYGRIGFERIGTAMDTADSA